MRARLLASMPSDNLLCQYRSTHVGFPQNTLQVFRLRMRGSRSENLVRRGADEWDSICRVFQKRHLLAHKMGAMDEDHIKKATDSQAVSGRKITVSREEVIATIDLIEKLGKRLYEGLIHPTP